MCTGRQQNLEFYPHFACPRSQVLVYYFLFSWKKADQVPCPLGKWKQKTTCQKIYLSQTTGCHFFEALSTPVIYMQRNGNTRLYAYHLPLVVIILLIYKCSIHKWQICLNLKLHKNKTEQITVQQLNLKIILINMQMLLRSVCIWRLCFDSSCWSHNVSVVFRVSCKTYKLEYCLQDIESKRENIIQQNRNFKTKNYQYHKFTVHHLHIK